MSSVTMVDVVFPGITNHHGTIIGGELLTIMDKAGFIAASRRARRTLVTVANERAEFHSPGRTGDILETTAEVVEVGRTSLQVEVRVTAETLLTGERRPAATGAFTYVAVDDEGRPTPIAPA